MTERFWNGFWRHAISGAKVLEVLAKGLGPVIAVLWIGWQYNQSRIDKRVEATLGYVTRFESSDTSIGRAQRALTGALWEHSEEIAEFRATLGTELQLQEIRGTIIHRVLKTAGDKLARAASDKAENTIIVGPIEEMDSFFNALATCVQGSVCDEASARRYFRCAVVGYLESFAPLLRARAKLAPNFGWGLRWLSEGGPRNGPCWQ